jgi:hypothetical protein
LVLRASAHILDRAWRLGFRGDLEADIERAIDAGELRGISRRSATKTGRVELREAGLVVTVRRASSPTGRRCWEPVSVRKLDGRRPA